MQGAFAFRLIAVDWTNSKVNIRSVFRKASPDTTLSFSLEKHYIGSFGTFVTHTANADNKRLGICLSICSWHLEMSKFFWRYNPGGPLLFLCKNWIAFNHVFQECHEIHSSHKKFSGNLRLQRCCRVFRNCQVLWNFNRSHVAYFRSIGYGKSSSENCRMQGMPSL